MSSPTTEQEDPRIPDFLRVENRKHKVDLTPGVAVKFLDAWEEVLNKIEPEKFRLYLRDMMRRGRFASQWLVPDGVRRTEKDVEDTLAHWRSKLTESENRVEERKTQKQQKKAAASDDAAVIAYESDKNPKKTGTAPYKRWELLRTHSGKTVAEFLEAGGNATTLKNAISSGYVTLTTGKSNEDGTEPDGAEDRDQDHRGEEAAGRQGDSQGSSEGEVQARRRGGRRGIRRDIPKRKAKGKGKR